MPEQRDSGRLRASVFFTSALLIGSLAPLVVSAGEDDGKADSFGLRPVIDPDGRAPAPGPVVGAPEPNGISVWPREGVDTASDWDAPDGGRVEKLNAVLEEPSDSTTATESDAGTFIRSLHVYANPWIEATPTTVGAVVRNDGGDVATARLVFELVRDSTTVTSSSSEIIEVPSGSERLINATLVAARGPYTLSATLFGGPLEAGVEPVDRQATDIEVSMPLTLPSEAYIRVVDGPFARPPLPSEVALNGTALVVEPGGDAPGCCTLLIYRAWLRYVFGSTTSTVHWDTTLDDDGTWVRVTLVPGTRVTFTPFLLGRSPLFTEGDPSSLQLLERPMWVSEVQTESVSAGTGTTLLAIDFDDGDPAGQVVELDLAWLHARGVNYPRVSYEDGTTIPGAFVGDSYRVDAPHFSIILVDEFECGCTITQSGWVVDSVGTMFTISDVSGPQGSHALVAQGAGSGDGTTSLGHKTFGNVKPIVLEFYAYVATPQPPGQPNWHQVHWRSGSTDLISFQARSVNTGVFKIQVNGYPESNSPLYNTGQWWHFALTNINWNACTYNLEVEGSLLQSGLSFPGPSCTTGVDTVRVGSKGYGAEPWRVDGLQYNRACDTPGPDAGGYYCRVVPETFADMSGAGSLTLTDDGVSAALSIGFSFPFYGQAKTTARVSANGFVCFTNVQCNSFTPVGIPSASTPNDLVACFWEDLYPPAGGTIKYKASGTAPNRLFVVEYWNIIHLGGSGGNQFQIQLHESGNVYCMLNSVVSNRDSVATAIGMENSLGTIGLQFGFNEVTAISTGIRFAPNQAPTGQFTVTPPSGFTSTLFTFNAGASTDDVDPTSSLQVRWTWESGGTPTGWSTSKTTTHQYATWGLKTVQLDVKDTLGAIGSTTQTVMVNSQPPVVTLTNPTNNAKLFGNVTFSGTARDPDGGTITTLCFTIDGGSCLSPAPTLTGTTWSISVDTCLKSGAACTLPPADNRNHTFAITGIDDEAQSTAASISGWVRNLCVGCDQDRDGLPNWIEWRANPSIFGSFASICDKVNFANRNLTAQLDCPHPRTDDVFAEVDYMEEVPLAPLDVPHMHKLSASIVTTLKNIFIAHQVRVHVDQGELPTPSGGGNQLAHDSTFELTSAANDDWDNHYNGNGVTGFTQTRRGYFHYMVMAHNSGDNCPVANADLGRGDDGGDMTAIMRHCLAARGGIRDQDLINVLMQELGHNLFGTIEPASDQFVPNPLTCPMGVVSSHDKYETFAMWPCLNGATEYHVNRWTCFSPSDANCDIDDLGEGLYRWPRTTNANRIP